MKNSWKIDNDCAIALNRLAREQMKARILADIRTDIAVCEIENINPREFIEELLEMISNLGKTNKDNQK